MDIENQEIIIKIPLRSKCYEFWFIEHPLYFLWLWLLSILLISILLISILISEFNKKH